MKQTNGCRALEWLLILSVLGAQIEFCTSFCNSDNDCSNSSQLCCEDLCVSWQNCKSSCKKNSDCDLQNNQICYNHRCLQETLTYPDVMCVDDKDCEDPEQNCKDHQCVIKTKTSHVKTKHLTWLKAVFIVGSVSLTLIVCVVFYCYQKRSTRHYYRNSSFIPMEARFQNITGEGFHGELSPSHQMFNTASSDTNNFSEQATGDTQGYRDG